MNPIHFENMENCIQDIRDAIMASGSGFPGSDNLSNNLSEKYKNDFHLLIGDLERAHHNFPKLYQEQVVEPFIAYLNSLGVFKFYGIFSGEDEASFQSQAIILNITSAILAYNKNDSANIGALQEVITDLYDGFLNNAERVSIETGEKVPLPNKSVVPPIAFFDEVFSPAIVGLEMTLQYGIKTTVVVLPRPFATHGLMSWSTIAHEVGGHGILHAYTGLLAELSLKVHSAVQDKFGVNLAEYWASRIDEAAADILGILNFGPAAGAGLLAFLRSLGGKLNNFGFEDDPHPADILRGFLAAEAVKHLIFDGAEAWSNAILEESKKDIKEIKLGGEVVSEEAAVESAQITARTIMSTKLKTLSGRVGVLDIFHSRPPPKKHSLSEFQNWTNSDQEITERIQTIFVGAKKLSVSEKMKDTPYYAAHVVSAAVAGALLNKDADIQVIFERMKVALVDLLQRDKTWNGFIRPDESKRFPIIIMRTKDS